MFSTKTQISKHGLPLISDLPEQEGEPARQGVDPVPVEQAQPEVLRLLRKERSLSQGR